MTPRALLAAALVAPALAALAAAPAALASCHTQDDLTTGGDLYLGLDDPVGAVDADWSVVSTPNGNGPYAATSHPDLWAVGAAFPYANWIGPPSTTAVGPVYEVSHALNGFAPYVYETTFTVDFATWPEWHLFLRYAADDDVEFRLNGNPVSAAAPAWLTWNSHGETGTAGAPGNFVNGVNVLEAHVRNYGGLTGLLVVGGVEGHC